MMCELEARVDFYEFLMGVYMQEDKLLCACVEIDQKRR